MSREQQRWTAVPAALVLSIVLGGPPPLRAQAPVKNPDGSTTTTGKDETYTPGGTKETTRDAEGHVTKEEYKDPKGKTVHIKYTTYPTGKSKRVDEVHFLPDGTPKYTDMTFTAEDGTETNEYFQYKDSMKAGGVRTVKKGGSVRYFKFNRTTEAWDEYEPQKWGGEWYGTWLDFALRDIEPPNISYPSFELDDGRIVNPFPDTTACCEPGSQNLAITIERDITVAPRQAPAGPSALPFALRWVADHGRLVRGASSLDARQAWPSSTPSPGVAWSGQAPGRSGVAGVTVVVTSLGTSQGEAFQLQLVNDGPTPVRLSAGGVVVEPLKQAARDETEKALQRLGPRLSGATTVRVEGYCLNYALRPPDAGMLFRVAPRLVQAQFAAARGVLRAASALDRLGRLTPDSNAKAYLESIKQYAVWTRLERWDVAKFSDAWVDMTRKQITASKRGWTPAMETTLRGAAPGRWRDIQAILSEAAAPAFRVGNDAGAR